MPTNSLWTMQFFSSLYDLLSRLYGHENAVNMTLWWKQRKGLSRAKLMHVAEIHCSICFTENILHVTYDFFYTDTRKNSGKLLFISNNCYNYLNYVLTIIAILHWEETDRYDWALLKTLWGWEFNDYFIGLLEGYS